MVIVKIKPDEHWTNWNLIIVWCIIYFVNTWLLKNSTEINVCFSSFISYAGSKIDMPLLHTVLKDKGMASNEIFKVPIIVIPGKFYYNYNVMLYWYVIAVVLDLLNRSLICL